MDMPAFVSLFSRPWRLVRSPERSNAKKILPFHCPDPTPTRVAMLQSASRNAVGPMPPGLFARQFIVGGYVITRKCLITAARSIAQMPANAKGRCDRR